jgi:hypothetical protein
MIKQIRVQYTSQWPDRSLMFPGIWIETYVLLCPGVWWLIDSRPEEIVG